MQISLGIIEFLRQLLPFSGEVGSQRINGDLISFFTSISTHVPVGPSSFSELLFAEVKSICLCWIET